MKINFPNGVHVTLSDEDERAIKIKQGYQYKLVNDTIEVTNEKKNFDWDDFETNVPSILKVKEAILELHKMIK